MLGEGFAQSPLDPCVFTLISKDASGKPKAHGSVGIHVDDS